MIDSIKAELILDAIAAEEGIEVSDDEAEDYIRENALAAGGDPKKVIADARKHGRIQNVKANLRLSKAVDLLVENATLVGGGEEGEAVGVELGKAEEAEAAEGEPVAEPEESKTETVADDAADEGKAGAEEDTGATGTGEESE